MPLDSPFPHHLTGRLGPTGISLSHVPADAEDMIRCLRDPLWRICSGRIYKVLLKENPDDESGFVMPFIPNEAQFLFLQNLHYRNVVLKARQLGLSTLAGLMLFDHAAFVPDQRCGMIAHTLPDAEALFRDKVKFLWRNLPEDLRAMMPLTTDNTTELVFGHNRSTVKVGVSMRSGTYHRLHVSELAKISKVDRSKAREVITGSLPAVPTTGIAIVESTPEGAEGEFYDLCVKAQAVADQGRMPLRPEWMMHFFPWWIERRYRLPADGVVISPTDHAYFAEVERKAGTRLDLEQRAWYVAKRENDFGGSSATMMQEYPSTQDECWQKSTEGTYFAEQLTAARASGRIGRVPYLEHIPVHSCWDIGSGDGTGIWLFQQNGLESNFLAYLEGYGQGYAYYVRMLRERKYLFGDMLLPHDARQKRQLEMTIGAPIDMLKSLAPDWNWIIVPQTHSLQQGIELTRQKFATARFDAEGCKEGLIHLQQYRKRWNTTAGVYMEEPDKYSGHSEAADAFRQWAQGFDPKKALSSEAKRRRPPARRPTGMMA